MQRELTRRRVLGLGAVLGGAAALGVPAAARPAAAGGGRRSWPTTLRLPDGFHPGGIAIGERPYAYFGSLLGGAVHRVRLADGVGTTIYPGVAPGQFDPRYMAVGLGLDHRDRLYSAGGWGGVVRVHSALTGEILRTYDVGRAESAVYGVAVTPRGVWFTDGLNGVLYGLPFGPGGALPAQLVTRRLGGDWLQGDAGVPTASGIAPTPDGRALLVVNLVADGGALFRVDPATGDARRVDLGGFRPSSTLGLALDGRTLYAAPQQDVTAIRLDVAGTRGTVVAQITDPRFDVPAAAAVHGNRLYLPNARFPLPPTPDTEYTAVAVPLV